MTARYLIADVFDGIASLEDGSIDLLLTSPPFLALRSYLPADHPDKHKEIGSEPTPEAFIDTLLDLVEAVTPKLAPHGSIAIELGDTFSGSGGGGGDYLEGGWREGQQQFAGSGATMRESNAAHWRAKNAQKDAWPDSKSLCLIPESFRWALVYGRNPFNGRETERWRARNVVRWCRPNPPVGALGDKYRPATSEMVVACKSRSRWFDLDAVREPFKYGDDGGAGGAKSNASTQDDWREAGAVRLPERRMTHAGAPPLDWWEIPTEPYKGSHYATWPRKLLDRPILSMCPPKVCRTCGEPSRRIVEVDGYVTNGGKPARLDMNQPRMADDKVRQFEGSGDNSAHKLSRTIGWSECACRCGRCGRCEHLTRTGDDAGCEGKWRRGVVLDCFAGSGTTLQVALAHGRDAIGIDLDERNAELAVERCGMFLTVERLEQLGVVG